MARITVLALALAVALAACSKITDPNPIGVDATHADAAPADAAHLSKPVAAITSIGMAGTPAQCTLATPSTGPGTISYVASWTIDGLPFTGTTTTTIAGDTVPNTATHTNGVVACTLFATNGGEAQASDPVSVTMKPRLAYVIAQTGITGNLETIDLDSFAETVIGPLNVNYAFGDIAWDATQQVLYMVDGRGAKALYTVDVNTGSATEIGVHGVTDVFALGFDGSGNLYGGVQNPTPPTTVSLQLVNKTSGAMTGIGGSTASSGLAFDSTRSIMMSLPAFTSAIDSVNLTNGLATQLAAPGSTEDCGLTYDPFTDALFAVEITGNLYRYDPKQGYARQTLHTFTAAGGGQSVLTAIAIILPPPP